MKGSNWSPCITNWILSLRLKLVTSERPIFLGVGWEMGHWFCVFDPVSKTDDISKPHIFRVGECFFFFFFFFISSLKLVKSQGSIFLLCIGDLTFSVYTIQTSLFQTVETPTGPLYPMRKGGIVLERTRKQKFL